MKLKSLMMAALAAAFVFAGCDKTGPTNSDQSDGTEQTDPNNPGESNPDDPNNPGGTDPGNPEDQIPSITLAEFRSLPISDKVYRISGVIWEIEDEEYASTNTLSIFIGDVPYNDDLDGDTGFAFIQNLKMPEGSTQGLKELGFKPGDVLTVIGKKGPYVDEEGKSWDDEPVIADAVYASFKAYDLPFLTFSMYANPYLPSTNAQYALDVYTNCSWTLTVPQGVTATPASGTGTAVVEFIFPDNTISEEKFYDVTFEYNDTQLVYKFQQRAAEPHAALLEAFENLGAAE